MGSAKRILYIEHSIMIGGSSVSLKEIVIDALRAGYHCTILCQNELVAGLYREVGAETWIAPVIPFTHNTGYFYRLTPMDCLRMIRIGIRTLVSFIKLYPIVRKLRPQIVHLNSSTLIAYTFFFKMIGIPTVFHVRENVVHGYLGIRRGLISKVASAMSTFIIYISEFELELLRTDPKKSFIIYNYVHAGEFGRKSNAVATGNGSRETVTLKLITLGGLFSLKGGKTILESMAYVGDNVQLLLLGSVDPRIQIDRFVEVDTKQYVKETLNLLNNENISKKVRFFGKVTNPGDYIQASDVLIFWAGAPHFPRTVFEAWILRKPVLYYNPLFHSNLINESNVCVVEGDSALALAHSINQIRESYWFTDAAREHCFQLAEANFTEKNFEKIDRVYQQCITLNP